MYCITLSMIRDFKYSNVSIATMKFLYGVHTCEEGSKLSGEMVFLLMTEECGPDAHKNCATL
jgi:hypothetical protein